jgi:hypothetical protein
LKKKIPPFVFLGFLTLTALASAAFYFSQPQAVALAEGQPTPVDPLPKIVEPAAAPKDRPQFPPVTQSDITVQVTSIRVIKFDVLTGVETDAKTGATNGVEIGICYTTLDDGEWRARVGQLVYGKNAIYADSIEYLDGETLADGKNAGTRCALVLYIIKDPDAITLPVEFSIGYFYAPYRELYSPCQEMQQRLATSPKAQKYGLKISCTDDAEKGPSLSLDEYSKSVNAEEAQKVFDVIATSEVHGEWKFVLTDIEK